MKAQPAAVSARDFLPLAKERHEEQQHEIGVHLGLEFEVAREVFAVDLAHTGLEFERGVQGVVDFLDENNERTDVFVCSTRTAAPCFYLLDEPARIVDADEKLIA